MKEEDSATEINLWLNGYNDLFSDFDHRNYSVRALSDDFLLEARRASLEKNRMELKKIKFCLPLKERNKNYEEIIKNRLLNHCHKHYKLLHDDKIKLMQKGGVFTITGIILMIIATFILSYYEEHNLLLNFLIILLEPGGWFFFWEGLGMILFESKKRKHELEFYEKMTNCNVSFFSHTEDTKKHY
ncbi:MAG: hypothetical protein AABX19_04255 [Nanoarchaeota archaeon]